MIPRLKKQSLNQSSSTLPYFRESNFKAFAKKKDGYWGGIREGKDGIGGEKKWGWRIGKGRGRMEGHGKGGRREERGMEKEEGGGWVWNIFYWYLLGKLVN